LLFWSMDCLQSSKKWPLFTIFIRWWSSWCFDTYLMTIIVHMMCKLCACACVLALPRYLLAKLSVDQLCSMIFITEFLFFWMPLGFLVVNLLYLNQWSYLTNMPNFITYSQVYIFIFIAGQKIEEKELV
jgi:hypothetical protein